MQVAFKCAACSYSWEREAGAKVDIRCPNQSCRTRYWLTGKPRLTCQRCGYTWTSKQGNQEPKTCPRFGCRSKYWREGVLHCFRWLRVKPELAQQISDYLKQPDRDLWEALHNQVIRGRGPGFGLTLWEAWIAVDQRATTRRQPEGWVNIPSRTKLRAAIRFVATVETWNGTAHERRAA